MLGSISSAFSSSATIHGAAVTTIIDTCTSIRYLVELMRIEWPNVQIIICTPSQTFSSYWTNLKTVTDLIKQCANLLGCDVIDCFYESPFSYYCQSNYANLKADGTHPTVLGAKLLSEYMIAQLASKIRPIIL